MLSAGTEKKKSQRGSGAQSHRDWHTDHHDYYNNVKLNTHEALK